MNIEAVKSFRNPLRGVDPLRVLAWMQLGIQCFVIAMLVMAFLVVRHYVNIAADEVKDVLQTIIDLIGSIKGIADVKLPKLPMV